MDVVESLTPRISDAERYKSKPAKPRAKLLEQQAVIVAVRTHFHKKDLQLAVKPASGKCHPENKVWLPAYEAAVQLGLQERIIQS